MQILVLNWNNELIAEGVDSDNLLDSANSSCKGEYFKLFVKSVSGKEDTSIVFEKCEDLLDWCQGVGGTPIYPLVGGARVPLNKFTYARKHYFKRIGWWDMTAAEMIIFCELVEHTFRRDTWISTSQLGNLLEMFGFTAASLSMHLLNLRKKLATSVWKIETFRGEGYRVSSSTVWAIVKYYSLKQPEVDHGSIYPILDNLAEAEPHELSAFDQTDYLILRNDKKLKHIIPESHEANISGAEYLYGWQGLTRRESQIYFELVKSRGEFVAYDHLLSLPWAISSKKGKFPIERKLRDSVGRIRRKIEDVGEVIKMKRFIGYCLRE